MPVATSTSYVCMHTFMHVPVAATIATAAVSIAATTAAAAAAAFVITSTAATTETSVACGRAACGDRVCACACTTCKGDPLVVRGDICTEAAPRRRCSRAQSRSQSPLPTRMMEMKWGLRASCCARWSWGGRGIGVGRGLRRKQRGTDLRGSVQSSNVRFDVRSQRAHRAWSSIQLF